jgi:predicted DNA-binding transcriptional regulator YafY
MKKIERLQMIIMRLKQKGKQSALELSEYLEVSKRTIYRDIDALSQMNIPIITFEGFNGGYQIDESYFMPTVQLSEREVLILMLLLKVSKQLNLPEFNESISALDLKLRNASEDCPEKYMKSLENITVNIQNIYPETTLHGAFETILEGFSQSAKLRIQYFSPMKNIVVERVISPLHLYYYEGGWYLDAYCHLRGKKRTFRLDRIREMVLLSEKAEDIVVKQYNEELLDDPKVLIEFDIDRDLYNLIKYDSAMNNAKIISEKNAYYRMNIETNWIVYFENLALRNVEQVTILKPQMLVQKLQRKIIEATNKYL